MLTGKSYLVLVLLLFGWEGDASFLWIAEHSEAKPKQMQTTFDTQLKPLLEMEK